jgi:protein required for attachment to host cells
MATTWIVTADSAHARILQAADRDQHLVEVENLVNPEGRMHDRELATDAEPRQHGPGGTQSAPDTTGPVEHSVDLFSKRIGDYLEKARTDHRYDRLVVVAPPKFLGRLRKNLGKEVEKLVSDEIDKDLYRANARELEAYFLKGSGRAP